MFKAYSNRNTPHRDGYTPIWTVAGQVSNLSPPQSLGWQSLCMPIPVDFELNNFLQKLADEVTGEDLHKLKALLHGDGGLQKRTLSSIESAVDFFTVLKEKLYLNRENLIFLQACLWNVGRRDLHRKCVEFATSSNKILHFYCPKEAPENGYQFIKFHVAGGLDTFLRPHLEHVRRTVAQLMGCPAEHVFVAGIEPSNSLVVTLMVLASYVDLLPCADKHELVLLRSVNVDKLIIKEGVEIEIPCFGGYHASEIRNILKRLRDLERQLDVAQQAKLEAEKEKRKAFQDSLTKSGPMFARSLNFSSLTSTPVKMPMTPTAQVAFVLGSETDELIQGEMTPSYLSQISMEKGSDMDHGYTRSIRVSNLPPDVLEEELKEYFERKQGGGGPVKDVTWTSQTGEAIINFQEHRSVDRLLESKPLLFKTHYIKVEPYSLMDDSRLSLSGLAEPEPMVTIEVSGFKPETKGETLEDYFENDKSGGQAESVCLPIRVESDRSVAYVKFKDREVADRVLRKEDHILEGVKLEVKECVQRRNATQPTFYKNKVFVSGIDPKTTQDGLENYLSNRANVRVSDTVRGEDDSRAVVTFASDIDIKKLQDMCKAKTLDGKQLTVENVKVTRSLLVRNVLETTTDDCLSMHFQYRVSGGKISEMIKQGEDSFLIRLSDSKVAGDVCTRYHCVDGQELEVLLYYECLGASRNSQFQMTFTPPESFNFDPKDMEKFSFLEKSSKAWDKLKSQLDLLHASAELQTGSGTVLLSSSLAFDVPDCRQKSKKWKKRVTKEMNSFFGSIVVETLNPLKEVWTEVNEIKEEFENEAEGSIVILSKADSYEVKVIGWKDSVTMVVDKLRNFIKLANENLEKIKNEISEVFQISKPLNIRILEEVEFCEKSQKEYPRCHVGIDEENLRVNFTGFPTDVYRAKCAMLELLHRRSRVPVGPFSKHRLQYLESPKIRGYLAEKMKEKCLKGLYEIRKDRYIEVNADTDEQAVKMAQFIKSFVVETPRKVTKFDKPLLMSDKFRSEMEKIQGEYNDLVKVIPDPENLVITTLMVSEVERNVLELIDNFLNKNVMVGESLCIPPAMIRYLKMFCMDDFKDIESGLGDQFHLQIVCAPSAVCVTAVETGLLKVEEQVMSVIQGIVRVSREMERPSVVKYLMGENARLKLEYVEQEFQCVVTADAENFNVPVQKQRSIESDMYQLASCDLHSERRVMVVKHDLTNMDVDVIVNAADRGLKLEGGLALVIGQKGGDQMYEACQTFIRKSGPLGHGEVFLCPSSGQLKCRAVIHAVGPVWQDGTHQEAELLQEVILSCLEECDKSENKYQSIAIPAISTGVFNYPREKATKVIVETIRNYFLEHQDSVLQNVYLCDIKTLVVEAFTEALKKTFPNVVDGECQGRAWKRLKSPTDQASDEMADMIGDFLKQRQPIESSVELTLYGHNQEQLNTAFQKFLDMADEDYTRKDSNDPLLKNLPDKQKTKLQNKARELGVHLDFGKLRVGRIKLYGLTKDVFDMDEVIQKLLRKQSSQQQQEREEKYFQAMVEWKRVFDDGQEDECRPRLNMMLEIHFRKSESRIHFQIEEEQFTADFTKMTLHDPRVPKIVWKLVRQPKTEVQSKPKTPNHWSPMADDDNLITIPLNHSKQEYTDVMRKLKEEFHDASAINWSSVVVERVQNRALFEQYSARKECMGKQSQSSSAPVERELWHTVDTESTSVINSDGFNRNFSNRKSKSLGQGVYFDVTLTHSLEETAMNTEGRQRVAYLCRVLTGSYTKGAPNLIVPPENKSGGSTLQCYDSVVDDAADPQTFVIFRDSQAYPEYMIRFSML